MCGSLALWSFYDWHPIVSPARKFLWRGSLFTWRRGLVSAVERVGELFVAGDRGVREGLEEATSAAFCPAEKLRRMGSAHVLHFVQRLCRRQRL